MAAGDNGSGGTVVALKPAATLLLTWLLPVTIWLSLRLMGYEKHPYIIFLLPVPLGYLLAGRWGGWGALTLGCLGLFAQRTPFYDPAYWRTAAPLEMAFEWLALAAYLLCGGLIVVLVERIKAASQRHATVLSRFKRALDETHEGVFMFDADRLAFFYANGEGCRQAGLHQADLPTYHPYDIMQGYTEAALREVLQPLVDGSKRFLRLHAVHHPADGAAIPVELFLQQIQLAGEPPFFLNIATDLTTQEAVALDLASVSERLARATDVAGIGLWEYDVECDTVFCNARMLQIRGLPPDSSAGSSQMLSESLHPEDRERVLGVLSGDDERTAFDVQYRVLRPDGEVRYVRGLGNAHAAADGRGVLWSGMEIDITEQTVHEMEVTAIRERLELATKVGKVGIFDFDHTSTRLTWDAQMLQIHGLKGSEFEGRYEDWLATVHPDDRQVAAANFTRQLSENVAAGNAYRIVRPDGSVRYIESQYVFLHDERGQPIRTVGCSRDVTLEREREHALREQAAALEAAVRDRTAQLARAKEKAEAATRVKSMFLANISHEVRSPMSAVIGYADLLLDSTSTEAERRRAAEAIRRNGSHLLTLINDLLDLSAVEANKLTIAETLFNPNTVVANAAANFQRQATEKRVALDVQIAPDVPTTIISDETRVRQIVINLIGNAVKFATADSTVRVVVHAQSDPAMLCIEVSDQGIGMSAEGIARLFRPFEQVDASPTRRHGGAGLGLSISQRLAELLGGRIHVHSREGEGSTFSFVWPLRVATPPPDSTATQRGEGAPREGESVVSPGGKHVVLAEDSLDLQKIVTFGLTRAGFKVTCVENGQQAIEVIARGSCDAVVMDIQMPVLDGETATRRLRENGCTLPIIGLSAHAMAGDRERYLAAGMSDYLVKPVDMSHLVATIREQMARKAAAPSVEA